jgi:hypothetical protein
VLPPRPKPREIRRPVKYLKVLLSQNIERALENSSGGCGGWVHEVCVIRNFVDNVTSFGHSDEEENSTYFLGDILEELD